MKRIAATALALALTAAAGSAAFAAQDYGRYDNRANDNRAMQYDNRYARNYTGTDVAQVVYYDHRGQGRALVAAEGQQGAARRAVELGEHVDEPLR